ncbi:MAG: ABC transporter substrate-binding protein [Candidatus Muiribacteriaceae bacterium]
MSLYKKCVLVFLISILLFVLTGCSDKPADPVASDNGSVPEYGDFFVAATGAEPVSLNPLLTTDVKSSMVQADIFDPVIKYNNYGEPEGVLAESWEIEKKENILFVHIRENAVSASELKQELNSARDRLSSFTEIKIHEHWADKEYEILEIIYSEPVDNVEIRRLYDFSDQIDFVCHRYEIVFQLRKDILWQDDTAFTSSDVGFTYEKMLDPETDYAYISKYYSVKSFDIPDRYSFRVVYYRTMANMLGLWNIYILPSHILKDTDMKLSSFNRNPVGTGPYILDQWNAGESIILSANPLYFEGRPYIDKYVYKIIPDKSQQFLSLMNNEIDYMKFSFDQYKNYRDSIEFEERFQMFRLPYKYGYTYIGYNNSRGFLKNRNVRKALSMAVDVNALIEGVYFGNATRVSGPYRLNTYAYNPNVPFVEFDPVRAAEILEKEGFVKNSMGIFEKNGEPLSITITTNKDNSEREHMAHFITAFWQKIGIKARYEIRTWDDIDGLTDSGDFDALLMGWKLSLTPDLYNIWHSDSIPSEEHPRALNFLRYKNPHVDRLLEKIRYEPEKEIHAPLCHKVHAMIAADHPATFLFAEDTVTVVDKRFRGIKVDETQSLNSWLEWWVPSELVRYK